MVEMHSFTLKFQKFLCRVRDTAPIAERSKAVFSFKVSQIRGKGVFKRYEKFKASIWKTG